MGGWKRGMGVKDLGWAEFEKMVWMRRGRLTRRLMFVG